MNKNYSTIDPEDYAEPRCVLCDDAFGITNQVKSIPQKRIIEKMNDYMSRRDYSGAQRHLMYWLEEAKLGHDKRGELLIRNELVGHFRKIGDKQNAFKNASEALKLIDELEFDGTISSATAYVNVATAYNAFSKNEEAILLFEKAKKIYESDSKTSPELLGGLYNNMALTNVALKKFDEAFNLYNLAIKAMENVHQGELEQAITYLNMADAFEIQLGSQEAEKNICSLLDKAYEMLDSPTLTHDGYYAFVCEKCAPVFSYYGYFLQAADLKKRAENIYERT